MRLERRGARNRGAPKWAAFLLALTLAGGGIAVLSSPAAAQVSRADSAAVLLSAAERLYSEGQSDAADALLRLIAQDFAGTAAAARVQELMATLPVERTGLSGRTELKIWSTLYGLWLGVAIPTAFGADGPEPYGVGLLLGGPSGFLAGSRIARSRNLTTGQARAITLGGTWGTWQGFGWTQVLDIGESTICDGDFCFSDDGTEESFAGAIIGGLAGIAVGTVLSRRNITPGVATTVNFGSLWGSWFGLAGGLVADLEDDKLLATTLAAGNAGLLYTALRAPSWRVTRSRARLVSIYGVIGALGGAGIDLLIQPDNQQVGFGIPLATSVIGLAVGVVTTRDRVADEGGTGPGMEPPSQALLNLDGRAFSFGAPMLAPTLRPGNPYGGDPRLALWIPLLSGRF